jgi:hypothetical protein
MNLTSTSRTTFDNSHRRGFYYETNIHVSSSVRNNQHINRNITSEVIDIDRGRNDNHINDKHHLPDRIYYAHEPIRFTTEFARCARERQCKLLYWHVQKTGGTYLASRLYKIINRVKGQDGYNSKEWCCHEDFMKRKFRTNTTKYCTMEFGVYEVRPWQYREVVETCRRQQSTPTPPQQRRTVTSSENMNITRYYYTSSDNNNHSQSTRLEHIGLITIREPLERTLSQIHQQCNVHRSHLKPKEREICNRCQYTNNNDVEGDDNHGNDDQSFFDHIANTTNKIYQEMKNMIDVGTHMAIATTTSVEGVGDDDRWTAQKNYLDIPMLILNNEDMDSFFDRLEKHVSNILSKSYNKTSKSSNSISTTTSTTTNQNDDDDGDESSYHLPRGKTNSAQNHDTKNKVNHKESVSSLEKQWCDFAMPSQFMKYHRPSLDVYRWFQQQTPNKS